VMMEPLLLLYAPKRQKSSVFWRASVFIVVSRERGGPVL
jgi:hypothetical protein